MKKPLPYNLLYTLLIIIALSFAFYSYITNKGNIPDKQTEGGGRNQISNVDADYGEDFETYHSDLDFSFKYPRHLFVSIDSDNANRIILAPKTLKDNEDAPLTIIVISVAENRKKVTPLEWLLGPHSGYKKSEGYYKTTIDGQDAVYTEEGMWTVVNTPDNKYRLSIADLSTTDADRLFAEMRIVIKSLTFLHGSFRCPNYYTSRDEYLDGTTKWIQEQLKKDPNISQDDILDRRAKEFNAYGCEKARW